MTCEKAEPLCVSVSALRNQGERRESHRVPVRKGNGMEPSSCLLEQKFIWNQEEEVWFLSLFFFFLPFFLPSFFLSFLLLANKEAQCLSYPLNFLFYLGCWLMGYRLSGGDKETTVLGLVSLQLTLNIYSLMNCYICIHRNQDRICFHHPPKVPIAYPFLALHGYQLILKILCYMTNIWKPVTFQAWCEEEGLWWCPRIGSICSSEVHSCVGEMASSTNNCSVTAVNHENCQSGEVPGVGLWEPIIWELLPE